MRKCHYDKIPIDKMTDKVSIAALCGQRETYEGLVYTEVKSVVDCRKCLKILEKKQKEADDGEI